MYGSIQLQQKQLHTIHMTPALSKGIKQASVLKYTELKN